MGAQYVRGINPMVMMTGRGAVRTLYHHPEHLGRTPGNWGASMPEFIRPRYNGYFTINTVPPVGITKNSAGVALPNCRVDLFKVGATNEYLGTTYSDSGGNYSFTVGSNSGYFFCRAYLPGSPDLAGTTTDTIIAV